MYVRVLFAEYGVLLVEYIQWPPSRSSDTKDKSVRLVTVAYIRSKRLKFRFCLNDFQLSARALGYAEIAQGFLFRANLEGY